MRRSAPNRRAIFSGLLTLGLALMGCGLSSTVTTSSGTPNATPPPLCAQQLPGSTPFTSLAQAPGLKLPPGSYINAPTPGGGAAGQYLVQTYIICFPGAEALIDGGDVTPKGTPTSTVGYLVHSGWTLNNLFPDLPQANLLHYCSNSDVCLNTSGSPSPFTIVKFGQYASVGSVTTVRLQVATIAAPTCLNDPAYYAGTPKYTLYYDGNDTNSPPIPAYHFQMPPGTRVSTFQGGGTAGSTYEYYCSAGTQATIVGFLTQAFTMSGWSLSGASASGFTATSGPNPTYKIMVTVQNPNNYYLRVFIPI
jgi:hypothetical protein